MPKRCVAANYSDTITDSVSLFRFPRYVARRRQWVLQVKRTRARWDFPVVYNASCVLCSDYFEADWFDSSSSVTLSVGYELQHKHVSLDTAVSKIFARSRTLKEAHHKWQVDRPRPRPRRIRLPSDYCCQLTVSPTLMVLRTLLVQIETTKVVATSSTRELTNSRSENANKE